DDKVLASWNGLMIRGLARAAFRLGRHDWFEAAADALAFVRREMWREGRLHATWKDGRARHKAYLDDYALLLDATLILLQNRWSGDLLAFAQELAEVLLADFADTDAGGFWFTAHDHEKLIQRRKDFADDAVPSGNGIAAAALARLGHLAGNERFVQAAYETVRAAMGPLSAMPHAHGTLLIALSELTDPPPLVVLRGEPVAMSAWRERCRKALDLRALWFEIPDCTTSLPPILEERRTRLGTVSAWLCEGFSCRAPVTEPETLISSLNVAAEVR